MTPGAQMATRWWSVPPLRQVTYLADTDAELLGIALDPLPDGAPAVVQFRPSAAVSFGDQIGVLLRDLDRAAVSLFPRWLSGAGQVDALDREDLSAIRALARRTAEQSHHFGPFLIDLAERSVLGRSGGGSAFKPEVRAAGLARVIAEAYGRDSAAILMEIPAELTPAGELSFVGAAEWLASSGQFSVWLAGTPLRTVDRVKVIAVALPEYLRDLAATAAPSVEPEIDLRPAFQFPPLSGVPRADSPAELTLERALAPLPWARGREWNHTFEATHLSRDFRLDLYWAEERVVVEVDGPDHRQWLKWADDRDRDVYLQMYGHNVLRFPNEIVLADVQLVVQKIHHVVSRRRAGARIPEMRHHAD
jgi:very-short-patch-repair endonuclease